MALHYYDYEDEGKLEKYRRVKDKLTALINRSGRSIVITALENKQITGKELVGIQSNRLRNYGALSPNNIGKVLNNIDIEIAESLCVNDQELSLSLEPDHDSAHHVRR